MISQQELEKLSVVDKTRIKLLALFRAYGYDGYKMAKFESYEVYQKNKDYIGSESIVTFTDSTGKLMALRPDVTMSIVNNLSGEQKKFYYNENVFRRDKKGDYLELRQLGIENIGGEGQYAEVEVVTLAAKALNIITEDFVLCIGNMDIVEKFISPLNLDAASSAKAYECIKAKAFHELKKLLSEANCDQTAASKLLNLVSLEGDMDGVLASASKLGVDVSAMRNLSEALDACALKNKIRLDFSIINDFAYYSGVNFRGYVKGVAKAVVTGGRYDKMTKRMGKPLSALGFAIDYDLVTPLLTSVTSDDIVIVQGNASVAKLAKLVEKYTAEGARVSVVSSYDGTAQVVYAEEVDNA